MLGELVIVAALGADVGNMLGSSIALWIGSEGQHDGIIKSALSSQTRQETSWDKATYRARWKH